MQPKQEHLLEEPVSTRVHHTIERAHHPPKVSDKDPEHALRRSERPDGDSRSQDVRINEGEGRDWTEPRGSLRLHRDIPQKAQGEKVSHADKVDLGRFRVFADRP